MDSVTALYEVSRQHEVVGCLGFDYGSKHNERELEAAAWHCNKLGVDFKRIRLDFIAENFKSDLLKSGGEIPEGSYQTDNMQSTVVPFRNGIMLSIAAGYAESIAAGGMVIAAHSGDHSIYPDCRPEFMQAMAQAIKLGTYAELQIIAPFINMDKGRICQLGLQLGIDYSHTWSCYKGRQLHCGKCATCLERKQAFAFCQEPDPTRYEQ